jgi:protocatechuate 3,4-dioxygenase beta subunit
MRRRSVMMAWIAGMVAAVGWLETAAQQPARDTPARNQADSPASPARITGRVVDGVTGRPMKMVTVRLISEAGGRSGQTDEAGVFDFTGLSAGRYNVRVQKAGYVSLAYGQRRPLLPGTPLQLDAGQHIKGIEFRMPRGSVVSGTISDELGEPMPGITVRLLRYQYDQGVRELVPAGSGQTDDRGIYRIWGLDAVRQRVRCRCPVRPVSDRAHARTAAPFSQDSCQ